MRSLYVVSFYGRHDYKPSRMIADIHWATVTVTGYVDGGDEFYASEVIAKNYWNLYIQKKSEWETEVVH